MMFMYFASLTVGLAAPRRKLSRGQGQSAPQKQIVPQCHAVSLAASYLAEVSPGAGPGFLLAMHNATQSAFAVPLLPPVSVHWYAANGSKWVWRASSGTGGGALLNALDEKGVVFAAAEPWSLIPLEAQTVAPGETFTWTASFQESPTLRYAPGCEHCRYPVKGEFRAVVGYALLPGALDLDLPWLPCGLRSNQVEMPPLAESQ